MQLVLLAVVAYVVLSNKSTADLPKPAPAKPPSTNVGAAIGDFVANLQAGYDEYLKQHGG